MFYLPSCVNVVAVVPSCVKVVPDTGGTVTAGVVPDVREGVPDCIEELPSVVPS